ncbi:MAG: hypothetical protein JWR35_1650 [Marmoricola sp.]|jgi:hypothetical protein|nr:hypothetical protein [Marmoricola sp.]
MPARTGSLVRALGGGAAVLLPDRAGRTKRALLVQHLLVGGVRRLPLPRPLAALAYGAAIYLADSMITDQVAAGVAMAADRAAEAAATDLRASAGRD